MRMYNLQPVYENRKSYYGKAVVALEKDVEKLISYNTVIGQITDGKVDFADFGYSKTSDRHLNEWLRQHDLDPKDFK